MTKEQRIEVMNVLERLGAETACCDCLFRNECESRADCIFDEMHDLIEKDGEQDVVEVVHGHWIQSGYCNILEKENRMRKTDKWTTYKCSICGVSNSRKFNDKYCRNCGAKMYEKDGDSDG